MTMTRRTAVALLGAGTAGAAPRSRPVMREVAPSNRFTVRDESGWYMHSAGVVALGDELVCTYRRCDEHVASLSEIWCARSRDGGRTWTDHHRISSSSWENDRACWVAPQLGRTRKGKLLLLADRGNKISKFDWPMLSTWQLPPRGMSNWLFASDDGGRTWQPPRKVDDVGGEPSYIIELSNGELMYTRTDSKPTNAKKNPAMPWGNNYYRSTAVFSNDGGATWDRTVTLADDPLIGDCEVGVAEYAPGKLIAITRVGDAAGRFGQPSRFVFSNDFGKTWSKPTLAPIYAHRPIVKPLRSGRLFVSYRNCWGSPWSSGFAFDPHEEFSYQPNSFLWDETRVRLSSDSLEIRSDEGREAAVEFVLYPLEDDESAVEFAADLQVLDAGPNGCNICAGAWLRFLPNRVELADRPQAGFDIDATKPHSYRIVFRRGNLQVLVDSRLRLEQQTGSIFAREVRFGNRSGVVSRPVAEGPQTKRQPLRGTQFASNRSQSIWRRISVRVQNRRDHSVNWTWSPKDGYPDQFHRDRVIRLERNGSFIVGNSGYSSWDQLADGTVVVVDYTSGNPPAEHPVLRAYRISPEWL